MSRDGVFWNGVLQDAVTDCSRFPREIIRISRERSLPQENPEQGGDVPFRVFQFPKNGKMIVSFECEGASGTGGRGTEPGEIPGLTLQLRQFL